MIHEGQTNRMTCTVCGWTRIVDPYREYHSVHKDARDETGETECSEMLVYETVDERPPNPEWFDIDDPDFEPEWE